MGSGFVEHLRRSRRRRAGDGLVFKVFMASRISSLGFHFLPLTSPPWQPVFVETLWMRVVLDTNVVISALRSRRGASFAILRRLGQTWFPLISVPLILEYEAVGKREAERLMIPERAVDEIVRAFCYFGLETEVHFRLRPFLVDPGDEFILELAAAGRADAIVTHNVRHFGGADRFGIPVMTPREFLRKIEGERP
jgi:putative PIN family toxin of toxin-antitoxin system